MEGAAIPGGSRNIFKKAGMEVEERIKVL